MARKLQGKSYVTLISLTAGLGGFLFGFDTAVISGAINFLRVQFHLTSVLEGWLMSSALAGCVLGAACAGYLADRFGRKSVLLASAVLFVISSVGCMAATNITFLVLARIVGGIGVGFAAMVAPMFISELSPAAMRGRLVSLYQLAITLGILFAYLSNAGIMHFANNHAGSGSSFVHFYIITEMWRAMLGSNMVPALVFFIFLLFVPESPRWLIQEDRLRDAQIILERINGMQKGKIEMDNIQGAVSQESNSIRQLFAPGIRLALIIGLVLPFLSQLAGITTVMYYAPSIFEKAGFGTNSAMGSAAIIGFFNMLFTFIAIWKIDQWGRKLLLMWGFIGLSAALFLIGILFTQAHANSTVLLMAFIIYIAIFAATLGPGVWVVISEIFPTRIRGRAMSLGTLSLFLGSVFVTQTYPVLRDLAGMGTTFILYALLMLPAAFFVYRMVPETKGRTLEDIGQFWKKKKRKEKDLLVKQQEGNYEDN
ncbi:MAG TPA: sugar porter family MFS transporter [Chitinophagaceae bacterium]|nr:sugar porter family MFS transporter [Chitinophagaceae bacterium]